MYWDPTGHSIRSITKDISSSITNSKIDKNPRYQEPRHQVNKRSTENHNKGTQADSRMTLPYDIGNNNNKNQREKPVYTPTEKSDIKKMPYNITKDSEQPKGDVNQNTNYKVEINNRINKKPTNDINQNAIIGSTYFKAIINLNNNTHNNLKAKVSMPMNDNQPFFDSVDDAAKNFAKEYFTPTVDNNAEYFAYIVETEDGKFTYVQIQKSPNGIHQWSPDSYEHQSKYDLVAAIHTHGKFPSYDTSDTKLRFSLADQCWSSSVNSQLPLYLANAAGELLKYDPDGHSDGHGQIFLISSDLPRQENVPEGISGYHPIIWKNRPWYWYLNPFNWGKDPLYRDGYK